MDIYHALDRLLIFASPAIAMPAMPLYPTSPDGWQRYWADQSSYEWISTSKTYEGSTVAYWVSQVISDTNLEGLNKAQKLIGI